LENRNNHGPCAPGQEDDCVSVHGANATGLPAQSFIDATLFREACRRLAYTRMTAPSIVYQLGFNDPSYFSRAFRSHVGLSPLAYRARFDV
jgi:AraC family transcriptional activator of pobA